jgi:hypothetical protein
MNVSSIPQRCDDLITVAEAVRRTGAKRTEVWNAMRAGLLATYPLRNGETRLLAMHVDTWGADRKKPKGRVAPDALISFRDAQRETDIPRQRLVNAFRDGELPRVYGVDDGYMKTTLAAIAAWQTRTEARSNGRR